VVALQAARGRLPQAAALPLQPLLTAIGDWQRDRIAGRADAIASPPAAVLDRLDAALAGLVAAYPTSQALPAEAIPAASALMGLRRNLFPQAPTPQLPVDAVAANDLGASEEMTLTAPTDTAARAHSNDLNKENPA
jgi:hypothetical protein